jgi:hypothetical protein
MFNLDHQVAHWRKQLISEGIGSVNLLDELESHLIDEFEQRVAQGSTRELAFKEAVLVLGRASELKQEFSRAGEFDMANKLKEAALAFAGIPGPEFQAVGGNYRMEPGWATYLKTILYLGPAVSMSILLAIFVIPKVQGICKMARLPDNSLFWKLTQLSIHSNIRFTEYFGYLLVSSLLTFGILEKSCPAWPRFRKSTLSIGAFTLNAAVLLSVFIIITALVIAVPALANR